MCRCGRSSLLDVQILLCDFLVLLGLKENPRLRRLLAQTLYHLPLAFPSTLSSSGPLRVCGSTATSKLFFGKKPSLCWHWCCYQECTFLRIHTVPKLQVKCHLLLKLPPGFHPECNFGYFLNLLRFLLVFAPSSPHDSSHTFSFLPDYKLLKSDFFFLNIFPSPTLSTMHPVWNMPPQMSTGLN